MSVQTKIVVACLFFVAMIATVGGLAQQQAAQMGRLAIGIYDHAFMGMSYVDQAEQAFLRLEADHRQSGAALSGNVKLAKVLELLDVALERAASERTAVAGKQTRALLAGLSNLPPAAVDEAMELADRSLTKLVKKFAADGLETRDDAEELAAHSTRLILAEIVAAVSVALGVGYLVGRNLSRPLVQVVRILESLAAGDLEKTVPATLVTRRDEIGAVARATGTFREALQQNIKAEEDQEQLRQASEADMIKALRSAADTIERESTAVAERSAQSGEALATHAHGLAQSAGRMMVSIDAANDASQDALGNCNLVAAAGEELASSAREIASQITHSASEIANTARAGEIAHQIIGQLSDSMGQISSVARLIGDIAGRTNLLALNATIEAARAGEAGRGFAVVAGEVKALARQTAESTQKIDENVHGILKTTQEAVDAVNEIVQRVGAIERITHSVAAAAEQQTAATAEIARSVSGTAASMRIVSGQIGQVTTEARQTGSAVGQMQSIAEAVAEQVAELRGVMVRIVRSSSDAANRRTDERIPVNLPGTLIWNGQQQPVMCLDLSQGGAAVRTDVVLSKGTKITLRLAGLHDLPGKVISGGNEPVLRFTWDTGAAPADLCNWLSARAA